MQESTTMLNQKFKAGDYVKHLPSGEEWHVCGIHKDGTTLIPSGYPFPSIARVDECILVKQNFKDQTTEERAALLKANCPNYLEPLLTHQEAAGFTTTLIQVDAYSHDKCMELLQRIDKLYNIDKSKSVVTSLTVNGVARPDYVTKVVLYGLWEIEPQSHYGYLCGHLFYISQHGVNSVRKEEEQCKQSSTLPTAKFMIPPDRRQTKKHGSRHVAAALAAATSVLFLVLVRLLRRGKST